MSDQTRALTPAENPFPDMLYRVSGPHFVAGFTVAHDGAVTSAAPIIAWMFDKPLGYIRRYCARNGWTLEVCNVR